MLKTNVAETGQSIGRTGQHILRNVDAGPLFASGREFESDTSNAAANLKYIVGNLNACELGDVVDRPLSGEAHLVFVVLTAGGCSRLLRRRGKRIPSFCVTAPIQ